jgi:hypothetical protein
MTIQVYQSPSPPTPSVAQLKATDQDLIKRALLVYYEQCLTVFHNTPNPDPTDETELSELELTIVEIAAMYGAITGEEIPSP